LPPGDEPPREASVDTPLALAPAKRDPSDLCYGLICALLRAYTSFFIRRVHVEGLEDLPSGPKILAPNHAHVTDGFVLPIVLHERLRFLMQAEVFSLPVIGRLLRRAGQIPVCFGHGQEALVAARECLQHGDTVVVFPEGRLNFGRATRRAGAGVILLALEANLPVIPIGIFTPRRNVRLIASHLHQRPTLGGWQFGGETFVRLGKPWLPECPEAIPLAYRRLRELTSQLMLQIDRLVQQAKASSSQNSTCLPRHAPF
jgi:1-acyl-sn-glycerol-3-phosphate acyltransferase